MRVHVMIDICIYSSLRVAVSFFQSIPTQLFQEAYHVLHPLSRNNATQNMYKTFAWLKIHIYKFECHFLGFILLYFAHPKCLLLSSQLSGQALLLVLLLIKRSSIAFIVFVITLLHVCPQADLFSIFTNISHNGSKRCKYVSKCRHLNMKKVLGTSNISVKYN